MHESQAGASPSPVPPAYLSAIERYAHATGLDAQALAAGQGFETEDATFFLVHYGNLDPDGLTVMMDAGELPDDPHLSAALTGPMLQLNAAAPSVVHGYYGYDPESDRLMHCTRIPLDRVADSAAAIASIVRSGSRFQRELKQGLPIGGAESVSQERS